MPESRVLLTARMTRRLGRQLVRCLCRPCTVTHPSGPHPPTPLVQLLPTPPRRRLAPSFLFAARERRGSTAGLPAASPALKAQGVLSAMGALAFSFAFPTVLVEVQATLRQRPGGPTAGAKMQRAIAGSLALALALYAGVGLAGYAAFGDAVPDNVLAIPGIGPAWVLVLANAAVVLHLLSAYQVYSQPVFAYLEAALGGTGAPPPGKQQQQADADPAGPVAGRSQGPSLAPGITLHRRLAVRSAYVVLATSLAAALPCFGQILGLIGAPCRRPAESTKGPACLLGGDRCWTGSRHGRGPCSCPHP